MVEKVKYGPQAHLLSRRIDRRRLPVRLAARKRLARHAREREVSTDLDQVGRVLHDRLTHQLAEPRHPRLRLEGLARRVMHVARAGHPLDDEFAVLCDVHLDAALDAHAARPFRRLVHAPKGVLQVRIRCQKRSALDEVLRHIHRYLLGAAGGAAPHLLRGNHL